MSAVFSTFFIVGVIGFLIVYGIALYMLHRRIARLEEQLDKWRFRR